MTYRISLRSSSLWEPRHPLLKVLVSFFNFTIVSEINPYFNRLYDKLKSNCYQSSYFLSKAMELNKWGVGVWAAEATISVDIIFVLLHTYII